MNKIFFQLLTGILLSGFNQLAPAKTYIEIASLPISLQAPESFNDIATVNTGFQNWQQYTVREETQTHFAFEFDVEQHKRTMESIPCFEGRCNTQTHWNAWISYNSKSKKFEPQLVQFSAPPENIAISSTHDLIVNLGSGYTLEDFLRSSYKKNSLPAVWNTNDTYNVCAIILQTLLILFLLYFASREITYQIKLSAKKRRHLLGKYRC